MTGKNKYYLNIGLSLFVMLLCQVFCSTSFGYQDGFGPYRDGEEPKAYPYKILKIEKEETDENPIIKAEAGGSLIVRFSGVDSNGQDSGEASLIGPKGSILAMARDIYYPMWGYYILEGDFNNDGKPDFALMLGSGGNGLAAETGQWVFFLSDKGAKYKAVVLDTDSIGINDLIDVGKDGCLKIVHTSLIGAPPEVKVRPGCDLYFRLYRLLTIRGTDLVLDGESDLRFPKMVAYMKWAEQKNHKETKLLSRIQKRALIKLTPINIRQGADVFKIKKQ